MFEKYLIAEKKENTKRGFQCFCAPTILIDSIYRKYEKLLSSSVFRKIIFC